MDNSIIKSGSGLLCTFFFFFRNSDCLDPNWTSRWCIPNSQNPFNWRETNKEVNISLLLFVVYPKKTHIHTLLIFILCRILDRFTSRTVRVIYDNYLYKSILENTINPNYVNHYKRVLRYHMVFQGEICTLKYHKEKYWSQIPCLNCI